MVAKCQNELDLVARDMMEQAKKNPIDVTKPFMATGPTNVERIDVDGFLIKLLFSYDLFPDNRSMWHLSISTDGNMVPESVLVKIKNAFFKDAEVIEMPSILFRGKVKQYISRVS